MRPLAGTIKIDYENMTYKLSNDLATMLKIEHKPIYYPEEIRPLIHPAYREEFLAANQEIIKTEDKLNYTFALLLHDNETITVDLHGKTVRNKNGKAIGIIAVISNQDLDNGYIHSNFTIKENNPEESNEHLESSVHDLKTPLNNIKSVLELVKDNISEDKLELLKQEEQKCKNALDIIDDLLESSRK